LLHLSDGGKSSQFFHVDLAVTNNLS
jgi:hypothetical protein